MRSACSRWVRASSSALSAASSAFTAGSTSVGTCAPRRSSRRTAAASAGTGDALPATASCASRRSPATFSACIMAARRSASCVSSPACGASLVNSSTAWRSHSASRAARSTSARSVATVGLGRAPLVPELLDGRGIVVEPAVGIEQPAVGRGIDQRARVVLAVDFHQRGAELLQRLHAHRLVVDEGPGPAVGELHAAQDQRLVGSDVVVGEQRPRRMLGAQARTSPSPGPGRRPAGPGWRRRARRAPARRRRAGSTCRRRSRRSAPTGRTRNRCRAGRSGRCRGSRVGPAWRSPFPVAVPLGRAKRCAKQYGCKWPGQARP